MPRDEDEDASHRETAAEPNAGPVAIPHAGLEPETLHAVIEAFVLREGTDYGAREFSLAEKVAHVRAQLERGDVRIMFDPGTDTVSIVSRA
jgi:hypothetical protein